MATVTYVNKPNPERLEIFMNAYLDWAVSGKKRYTCKQCFGELQTPAEMKAGFCARHIETRKAYKIADAFKPRKRSQRGHGKRNRKGAMK